MSLLEPIDLLPKKGLEDNCQCEHSFRPAEISDSMASRNQGRARCDLGLILTAYLIFHTYSKLCFPTSNTHIP